VTIKLVLKKVAIFSLKCVKIDIDTIWWQSWKDSPQTFLTRQMVDHKPINWILIPTTKKLNKHQFNLRQAILGSGFNEFDYLDSYVLSMAARLGEISSFW
jgi:hypothetical protein